MFPFDLCQKIGIDELKNDGTSELEYLGHIFSEEPPKITMMEDTENETFEISATIHLDSDKVEVPKKELLPDFVFIYFAYSRMVIHHLESHAKENKLHVTLKWNL